MVAGFGCEAAKIGYRAGMNITKKGSRVTGEDRVDLATQVTGHYDAGKSIRAIAAATGRSYGFVHRVLVENGATMRSRGGATRRAS